MKILYLGDIVGSSGRRIIKKILPKLKSQYKIDVTIANAENAAHGKGITKKIYYQLKEMGIDYFTMGNHTYSKKDIFPLLEEINDIATPYNEKTIAGKVVLFEYQNKTIALVNILCEVFMQPTSLSPFEAMEEVLHEYLADMYIVDIHGEATSEKIAFFYHFKNRVNLIVGTHTHVQTSDEKIVDGCGYITDLGMCGTYHSILGRDIDEILSRFLKQDRQPYKIAEGEAILHGVVVEIDSQTNQTISIEKIKVLEDDLND